MHEGDTGPKDKGFHIPSKDLEILRKTRERKAFSTFQEFSSRELTKQEKEKLALTFKDLVVKKLVFDESIENYKVEKGPHPFFNLESAGHALTTSISVLMTEYGAARQLEEVFLSTIQAVHNYLAVVAGTNKGIQHDERNTSMMFGLVEIMAAKYSLLLATDKRTWAKDE